MPLRDRVRVGKVLLNDGSGKAAARAQRSASATGSGRWNAMTQRSDFGGTCDDETDEHGLLVAVEIFEVELILQAHQSEREVDGILACIHACRGTRQS